MNVICHIRLYKIIDNVKYSIKDSYNSFTIITSRMAMEIVNIKKC